MQYFHVPWQTGDLPSAEALTKPVRQTQCPLHIQLSALLQGPGTWFVASEYGT